MKNNDILVQNTSDTQKNTFQVDIKRGAFCFDPSFIVLKIVYICLPYCAFWEQTADIVSRCTLQCFNINTLSIGFSRWFMLWKILQCCYWFLLINLLKIPEFSQSLMKFCLPITLNGFVAEMCYKNKLHLMIDWFIHSLIIYQLLNNWHWNLHMFQIMFKLAHSFFYV